jgi:hypothetical protein
MKNRLAIVLVCVALVIGLSIAAMLALLVLRRTARPHIANTATVIQQIQSLSELVTVKYVMQKVVIITNESTSILGQLPNQFKIPGFAEDRIMLLAHGVVKAGVDLGRVTYADVDVSDQKISLRLPASIVTDAYLDENQTQILDRQTGVFRQFEKTLEQQARQEARNEMNRAARQSGIEREANERAKELLTKLLKTLGYKEVEVRTRAAK